ncbi:hypothetical protein I317_02041 [Kwoniella heveanensis CBS 569]|uniref:Uncharacterized protein n=1 Tax=Kwoniella heveanensis BCC8398 TaxID=1296120 RepID=A0A1B9GZ59_9TREE|nr:hypothetical protein I316_02181 [Kwoniella heveanensis BCC8398]OCF44088.1 hypothetical protein I317_02041 [Kwoniella heveanensis CBS 569]
MTTFPTSTPTGPGSTEFPIDPTLIEQQPLPVSSPVKATGHKRKNRSSGASSSAGATNVAGPSRITRRSAAAAAGAGHSNGPSSEVAGLSEPTRGEEENLNAYWGAGTNKRARLSSPTKRSTPATTTNRFYPPDASHPSDESGPSTASKSSSNQLHDAAAELRFDTAIDGFGPNSALAGIEELAAAAIAANDKSSDAAYNHASEPYHYSHSQTQPYPFPHAYTYPVGLTPFRYPCLTPEKPPPPPGDPKNPKFRPFDPHAPINTQAPEVATNGPPSLDNHQNSFVDNTSALAMLSSAESKTKTDTTNRVTHAEDTLSRQVAPAVAPSTTDTEASSRSHAQFLPIPAALEPSAGASENTSPST